MTLSPRRAASYRLSLRLLLSPARLRESLTTLQPQPSLRNATIAGAQVALALVLIAGVDVYLLQSLSSLAKTSPSLADDALFVSELSIALYVLPVVFGGIGVNLISHVLLRHLTEAEKRFEREHPRD